MVFQALFPLNSGHVQKCADTEPAYVRTLQYCSASCMHAQCIIVYGINSYYLVEPERGKYAYLAMTNWDEAIDQVHNTSFPV